MEQYTVNQFKELNNDFFKFRSFDLEIESKHIRIKKIIKDREEFAHFLNYYNPDKVWFQACKFLNPQMQHGRKFKGAGYRKADNLFLYKDMLVIDIDQIPANKYINNLIAYFIKEGYPYLYAIPSKGKNNGIQIGFDSSEKLRFDYPQPEDREKATIKALKSMYNQLHFYRFDFIDEVAFINPRQVYKVPNSFCNEERCEYLTIPVRLSANDTTPRKTDVSAIRYEQGERPGISSLLLSYNVSSRIIGTRDNQILLMDFYGIDEFELKKSLKDLIKIYNLSDLYVFLTSENRWHVYCLKSMQYNKIKKIYHYLNMKDMLRLLKRQGEVYLRFSPKIDSKNKEHAIAPKYLFTVKGKRLSALSLGHFMFLRKQIGLKIDKSAAYVGNPNINVKKMWRNER